MEIKHFVRIYSKNGVIEGYYNPIKSTEDNITIERGFMATTIPIENISRMIFIPERIKCIKISIRPQLVEPTQIEMFA